MGRHYSGSWTVNRATVLRISDVRQLLKQGHTVTAEATFPALGSMELHADWTGPQPFLRLRYQHINGTLYDYRIGIDAVKSNLGRGQLFYFRCPETGRRCRMLYMAYNYPSFKAREAYRIRLYYPKQLTGGRGRYNALYWMAEEQLEQLSQRRQSLLYAGRPTRYARKIDALEERLQHLNVLRWTEGLPPFLR